MRTKVIITLKSGEVITKEYDVTLENWHLRKPAIQAFLWRCIKREQEETIELKRKCETCGKSCEGCVRNKTTKQ